MATIETLDVAIRAVTGPWEAGLKQAETKLAHFVGFATKVFAGGVLLSVGNFIMQRAEAIAELGDAISRLGVNAERFQTFLRAGNSMGLSARDWESTLSKLSEQISKAAVGGGEAAEAFDALGLSMSKIRRMPVDEAFLRVTEALNSLGSSYDRVRLSQELFGESGSRVLQAISENNRALERTSQLLTQLEIDSTRAFSRMKDDSVEMLKGGLDKLIGASALHARASWNFLTGGVTGVSLMVLDSAIDARWDEMNRRLAEEQAVRDRINKVMNERFKALKTEADLIGQSRLEIDLYHASILGASDAQGRELVMLHERIDALREQQQELDAANARMRELEAASRLVFEATRTPAERMAEGMKKLNEMLLRGLVSWETWSRAVRQLDSGMQAKAERIFEATRTPFERFRSELEELEELMTRKFILPDTYHRALEQLQTQVLGEIDRNMKRLEAVVGLGQQVDPRAILHKEAAEWSQMKITRIGGDDADRETNMQLEKIIQLISRALERAPAPARYN